MMSPALTAPTSAQPRDNSKLLLDAGFGATKVVWLCRSFMVLGIVPLVSAPNVLTSLTNVAGELEPLDARIALASLLFGVGLLMTVGLWLYLGLYVTRLTRTKSDAFVSFAGVFRTYTRRIPVDCFRDGGEHEGRTHIYSTGLRVDAPYRTARVRGWWLPLILDQQAETFDGAGLDRLIADGKRRAHALNAA